MDVGLTWRNCAPKVGPLYSGAADRSSGQPREPRAEITDRDRDLARSTQELFETALFNLLAVLHQRYQVDCSLAGGCAMNSVGNGKIHERSPFQRSMCPPAAGDAGGAIGAAATVWSQPGDGRPCGHMDHADWGPSFDLAELERVVDARSADLKEKGCVVGKSKTTMSCSARPRARDRGRAGRRVVPGPHGVGPRALGNRSILCDPRRADMKDLLNAQIKHRESFRPFALSLLEDARPLLDGGRSRPHSCRRCIGCAPRSPEIPAADPRRRDRPPADGPIERNPRYHALIEAFEVGPACRSC